MWVGDLVPRLAKMFMQQECSLCNIKSGSAAAGLTSLSHLSFYSLTSCSCFHDTTLNGSKERGKKKLVY